MSLVKTVLYALTAAIVVVMVYGQENDLVTPNCLGCLCEASTQCNASSPCHTPAGGGYYCGAFLISWAYWADAGKPVLKGDNPEAQGAFENCVLDLHCAAVAVRQYMKKFARDCNGDGVVTCTDFVRIHKYGQTGCTAPLQWSLQNSIRRMYCSPQPLLDLPGVTADCNGDGEVNCVDFAHMHMLGGFGCRDSAILSSEFYKRFDTCWKVVQAAG
nr:lysozyme-like isoform X2 [Cherax quadricarinatus]